MSNVPANVQRRTSAARGTSPSYIAWNGAGAVFNVRRDATSGTWRATAQRFPSFYSAPTLRQLAMILDRDTVAEPALVPPAGASDRVRALYVSWSDGGARDRAEWSGLV